MKTTSRHTGRRVAVAALLVACGVLPEFVAAAVTDLANAPLANGLTSTTTVKPNIAFIVDDSGSMDEQNMPNGEESNRDKRCWGSHKYNTLFYNPGVTYKPPFKIDGAEYSDGVTRFPDADFTKALKDGYFEKDGHTFSGGSGTNTITDLSSRTNLTPYAVACRSGEGCSGSTSKYYYSVLKANANSTVCDDSNYDIVIDPDKIGAPGIPATGRTAEQIAAAKTNYANWYSYYRRRALLMKAATGEAFKDLDESKYRVGLFFLNSEESGADNSTQKNNDLKIDDFSGSASGTQRHTFYSKLYGSRDGGWTPLRAALSRMGRMYAGKIDGWDPVQYSCQQNFTILSTDGYWNTNAETSSYGPLKINGSDNVGKQDGPASSAASASATITISGDSNSCYRVESISVNTGSVTEQLLGGPVPDLVKDKVNCLSNVDSMGEKLRDAIKAQTSITKFSASYDSKNNKLLLTAPASLGDLTATPSVTYVKQSGKDWSNWSFNATAFSGGAAAVDGAVIPYKDTLNIADTLADVAYYYYTTDLRDATRSNCSNVMGSTTYSELCTNNVRGNGKDTSSQQHMTTFTIGLGVNGTIKYESNYETANKDSDASTTQYYDIVNESVAWPQPNTDLKKIDDLWHAAVNGRGTYYSATDAQTLKAGIQSALAGIQARKGSSAAAATSNLEPVAGDNYVYVALYQTVKWDGDLMAFSIDPATGVLSDTDMWSAQESLDSQVSSATSGDGRTIKFFSAGATGKLKDFDQANLTADGLNEHFENVCAKSPAIDQCGSDSGDLTTAQKTLANNSANLINYLRGSSQFEDKGSNTTAENRIYRGRDHVLGDIVNAVPVYMKKPPFSYDTYDTSYATFKNNNADRAGTVFIAANDGMLHAINAENGTERWAYVPTFVMKNMWRLADRNYGNNHQYFVDGSPTIADICTSRDSDNVQLCASNSNWKTIVVGGLNKGGCGYYALDVTDPTNPKGLWEFSNDNLGYSYGNPVVAKRKDGRWVVIFTSGYNNYPGNGCGSTGDGNGHVFVVDATTGELLEDIETYTSGTTQAGSTSTPSGLAKLNAWIDDAALPIADRLYGGDMLGNVWRIDFDNNYAPDGKEAVLLAQLKDGSNNPQPITTKPELAVVPSSPGQKPIVLVGTGKYLGTGDMSDKSQQSIYALKDSLLSTGISDVRGSTVKARTLTETTGAANGSLAGRTIRTVSGDNVNWSSDDGWRLDLNPGNSSPGERVNVDMSLQFNILTVAANVPVASACDVGGYAFLYFLDINTGKHLITASENMAGFRLGGNALVAGIKTVRLTSGKTVTIVTDTAGNVGTEENPSPPGGGGAGARRTTWREIPD